MNEYEARQEAKRQRLQERADKARGESDRRYKAARYILDVIPMGQPILVGHHSEGRHRRDLGRVDSNMRKSIDLGQYADHLEHRAENLGQHGISSDDPEAIDKLRAKLAGLDNLQKKMRAANGAIRAKDDAALLALGFDAAQIAKLKEPDFCGRIGFPDYALTNNSGNMRRIRLRIDELKNAVAAVDVEIPHDGFTVREDTTENRVMIIFPGKPPAEVRDVLKSWGFKWSPTRGAWVRFLNNAGRAAARFVADALNRL